jgi:plastocyanin
VGSTRWFAAIKTAALAATLLAGTVLPARAGDIAGSVTIKSALRPPAQGKAAAKGYGSGPDEMAPYGSSGDSGEDTKPRTYSRQEELGFVVLYLTGSGLKATPEAAVMHQHGREFNPHVLVVPKGSTVQFTNEDPFLHNIYSPSTPNDFELPKYSNKMKEKKTFTRPGFVELFCSVHTRMNAYIVVVDNNYFATATGGHFVIHNVPPGTYTLHAWHPRLSGEVRKSVTVPASGNVSLDINV